MYDYVIYHKNCFDGFSGFMVLTRTKKISKDAIILPDVPSSKNVPNDIEGKNIIIIDVAYKIEILKRIFELAKKVTFIDHHITISDDVKKMPSSINKKHEIIYDLNSCGATLTWKYFFKNKPLPYFLKLIEDNDTGKWIFPETIPFITYLEVKYPTDLSRRSIAKWKNLFDDKMVAKLINKGNIYYEYKVHIAETNAKKYSMEAFPSEKIYEKFTKYFEKPFQYKVALYCGMGCPSVTELGKKILDSVNCDFVIMWALNLDKKEYVLSFRSKSTDVGNIAKIFGGGGHTLAAACSFSSNEYFIGDLFAKQSLQRN